MDKESIWDSLDLDLDDETAISRSPATDIFNDLKAPEVSTGGSSPPSIHQLKEFYNVEDMLLSSMGMDVVGESLALLNKQDVSSPNSKSETIDSPYLSLDLQDHLVSLFMTSVYILCPAVNAAEFCRWYDKRHTVADEGSLKSLVLQAILFVTFPHLDDQQIQASALGSVPEAQKVLFEYTLGLYQTATLTREGHVALTQTALLLSHWSPYNNSREVNSFWIDEAFRHAILGNLHKTNDCHDRRTWWCCIVRNRVLALALCRPNKLRLIEPGRPPDVSVCEPNPVLSSSNSDLAKAVDNIFVTLCKLSTVMSDILALHNSLCHTYTSVPPPEKNETDEKYLQQLMDVKLQLQAWAEDYESVVSTIDQGALPRGSRVQLSIIRIIYISIKASLYEPFISSVPGSRPVPWLLRKFAMSRTKEVSLDVSAQVGELLGFAKMKDIPLALPAWLVLPVAVHLMSISSKPAHYALAEIKSLGNLMRLLHGMSSRFEGVQFIIKVIQNVINALKASEEVARLQEMRSRIDQSERAQAAEILLLTTVVDIIRSGLAHEDLVVKTITTRL